MNFSALDSYLSKLAWDYTNPDMQKTAVELKQMLQNVHNQGGEQSSNVGDIDLGRENRKPLEFEDKVLDKAFKEIDKNKGVGITQFGKIPKKKKNMWDTFKSAASNDCKKQSLLDIIKKRMKQ